MKYFFWVFVSWLLFIPFMTAAYFSKSFRAEMIDRIKKAYKEISRHERT